MSVDTQVPPKPPGFWKRQFSDEVTRPQIIFDVLVGGVIPIVLLALDPIIFRSGCFTDAVLEEYQIFAYLSIGLGILTLFAWLAVGRSIDVHYSVVAAGILLSGGLFALALGIVMLPLSVLGLIFLIGALGFFPFLTSVAYLRNGIRALRRAHAFKTANALFAGLILGGALVVFGPSAAAQWQVTQIIENSVRIIAESPVDDDVIAIQHLRTMRALCIGMCDAKIAYELRSRNTGTTLNQPVAKAYNALFADKPDYLLCGSSSE